ncbi:MAG: hypothetical protein DRI34_01715 [Deltaproteobacteria bacterium]|nr:MAG: hypothetical protein DRI34_01715 [Deltaproteobacteria bacterium]
MGKVGGKQAGAGRLRLLLITGALLAGCGVKGPPRPPVEEVTAPARQNCRQADGGDACSGER